MKTWNININAENEEEALKLINVLAETFKTAVKFGLPLDHIYADMNGCVGDKLVCERTK
jgi:hypothetical protein